MDPQDTAPLRDVWYFAIAGAALKPGRLAARTILDEPVLLGRDRDGNAFALVDLCPHRGIPLRFGRFDGREVECCYHGWRFDTTGQCTAIPSLVEAQMPDLARIRVRRYPVREALGGVWVCLGDEAAAPDLPAPPELAGLAPRMEVGMRFAAPMDHAVLGLMDPSHGAFVHRSWFWRARGSMHDKAKAFEPSPWGFTMVRHPPSANSRAYCILGGGERTTEIAFRLPGLRTELIRVGRHVMGHVTALTPVSGSETEINHLVFWTMPWLSAVKWLLRPIMTAFLRQDRDVIVKQQLGLKHHPPLLLLGDPDGQARWYYRLKNEFLRSRSEGRPFENPIRGRVLRWRS